MSLTKKDKIKYFEKQIDKIEERIWFEEFNRYKMQEDREESRKSLEQAKSSLMALEEKIKSQKDNPTMEKGEIARLDDQKVLLEKDIEKMEESLKASDIMINGSKPTAELKDGFVGVNNTIAKLTEGKQMLKEYLKQL